MAWTKFDAREPDPQIERTLEQHARTYLQKRGIAEDDTAAARASALADLAAYKNGKASNLDEAISINVFRPHEFDDRDDLEALNVLMKWLIRAPIRWRGRSDHIKPLIKDRFGSAGSTGVDVQGDSLVLDALVEIGGKRVAIEFEISNNLDNGIFTLRTAVQKRAVADLGVMIVPLSPRRSGYANARTALNRLDVGFDGSDQSTNGAVYRVTVVRRFDVCEKVARLR
ncbi:MULTISPECIES: hypothetical protein [Rhizobium]|uniref:hypothetical protein n=1 Tax=Rhizobium TaxID=379 RepID=UPI0007E53C39|nr:MULTISPECIES: hypothetical protein [Rhizobium]MBY3129807.1 hypothetical protein [Rhizobium laguerreae]